MQATPRTIVVPTDLSAQTRTLLEFALQQPHEAGGRVILTHVVHIGEHVWSMLARSYDTSDMENKLKALANSVLDEITADHDDDHPFTFETQVHWGDPAEVILSVAKVEKADQIVMGRHAPGMVKNFFLGSTADKVIRGAHCAVSVIPMAALAIVD
jgi:nucleotide-binding universal stress UspA family protein